VALCYSMNKSSPQPSRLNCPLHQTIAITTSCCIWNATQVRDGHKTLFTSFSFCGSGGLYIRQTNSTHCKERMSFYARFIAHLLAVCKTADKMQLIIQSCIAQYISWRKCFLYLFLLTSEGVRPIKLYNILV